MQEATAGTVQPINAARREGERRASAPFMNVNRLLWLTMTLLCGIAGGLIGWKLGVSYTEIRVPDGPMVQGPLRWVIIVTITLGSTIILARIGSWLADRVLMSLAQVHRLSVADRVLGITGVLLGVVFGALVSLTLNVPEFGSWMVLIKICLLLVSMALGVALLHGMRSEMLRVFPALDEAKPVQNAGAAPKILDTNVIIDGRIADLCRSGFIEGTVYVPNFVLNELQYIADSADSLRRARGRRGLEALNAMRDITVARGDGHTNAEGEPLQTPLVQVLNEIPASVLKIDTVDSKLVALAKEMSGAIVTNDFNLNRVAELQGIRVLNLNQLALSLKPVVLPGEELSLTIVREGKEAGQGVGYLEDGTMVVVGDGREHVGETCKVTITQVIQTVAGKMIFAEFRGGESAPAPRGPKGAGDDLFDSGNGNNGNNGGKNGDDFGNRSGGGMRRKGKS
jgi:uncharacterized protein YacL